MFLKCTLITKAHATFGWGIFHLIEDDYFDM